MSDKTNDNIIEKLDYIRKKANETFIKSDKSHCNTLDILHNQALILKKMDALDQKIEKLSEIIKTIGGRLL